MQLEDALLYLIVDCRGLLPREAAELCREAVRGGVDAIELGPGAGEGLSRELVTRVADACREEDALLLVRDEPSLARDVGAAGVRLTRGEWPVAYARSVLSGDSLVGLSSDSGDEAVLALDVDPDYLLHFGGADCPGVFARLRTLSSAVLFAAGIDGLAAAREIVAAGVYRLCLELAALQGSVTESAAEYSRLLGRDMR